MQLKNRLATLKEDDDLKAFISGNEEEKAASKNQSDQLKDEKNGNDSDDSIPSNLALEDESDEEEEEDLGANAQVSLLDQHNVLKKKAEGK